MKIVKLEASNFKKLTAIEIVPDGNVVTLTGNNGAGKSSILDAIMAAIAGGKSIPEQPVRKGEIRCVVQVDIGSLRILRTITPSGTTLRIEDKEGNVQRSPQAILDDLVGNLAFDPLAFSRLKSHEQWAQLSELVGLNFSKLDADRQKAYDERTVVNREVLRLQTLIKEIPPTVDDAPETETSAASVLAEIESAEHSKREADFLKTQLDGARANYKSADESLMEAEREIAAWQAERTRRFELRAAAHEAEIKAAKAVEDYVIVPDVAPLKEKLKNLEASNAKVRAKVQRRALIGIVCEQTRMSERLTQNIEDIDKTKTRMIADAKFPLPELSFNGTEIVYNGIPFAQSSDGEKLKVSVAVGMALNPKLRVIFVRDGSLLDEAGLKTIADLATANDYQVWLEDARSTDPSAIEIVDGGIK